MQYIYKHPKDEKYIEVTQSIHDEHEFVDENGVEWNRVFTAPMIHMKENIDPTNAKQFSEVVGKQKGTYQDVLDRSKELSLKREDIYGTDPIKNSYLENYSKERKGKKHPEAVKKIEANGVSVEF